MGTTGNTPTTTEVVTSNCTSRQTFVIGTPPTYGSPNPRYIKPLVRINGMTNDVPFGYTLNPCILPMDAIAAATNQNITIQGKVITLSGNGGSVTLPADKDEQTLSLLGNVLAISNGNSVKLQNLTIGTAPATTSHTTIPTTIIGTQDYILGAPDKFLAVTIDGTVYNIPAYLRTGIA